jgi:redox-sensitive bicupin YhaK (pirin superfamily)
MQLLRSKMTRDIDKVIRWQPTIEGAGVRLCRGFSQPEKNLFDPFLLLDDFHSDNPDDYMKGFPWHPHRGIETVTYVLDGKVEHEDSLGNKGVINPGFEVTIPTESHFTAFTYILKGSGVFSPESHKNIGVHNVILFTKGDNIRIRSNDDESLRFLFVSGKPFNEPIAWGGPVVMNSEAELRQAFKEFQNGSFIK